MPPVIACMDRIKNKSEDNDTEEDIKNRHHKHLSSQVFCVIV